MAVEHVRFPVFGVQFHPESILTQHGYGILANFLKSASIPIRSYSIIGLGMHMILEGILTTTNEDGTMHVAPMGPEVDRERLAWTLKPFKTSTTYANLRATQQAVFHVVDDSLLLAQAVLGQANHAPAHAIQPFGFALDQACEWFALEVTAWDESTQRSIATADCALINNNIHSSVGTAPNMPWSKPPFWSAAVGGWNRK